MSIEAMKQALEALELALCSHGVMLLSDPPQDAWKTYNVEPKSRDAITALRTAIEQAEKQEPVAWMNKHGACKTSLFREVEAGAKDEYTIPLYTAPPAAQRQWAGLTDAEIEEWDYDVRDVVMDIEKLLREKNT